MTTPLLSDPKQIQLLLVLAMQADIPTFNESNAQRKELNYQFEQSKRQSKNERLKEKNHSRGKPDHFGKSSTPIHKSRKP